MCVFENPRSEKGKGEWEETTLLEGGGGYPIEQALLRSQVPNPNPNPNPYANAIDRWAGAGNLHDNLFFSFFLSF